MPRVYVILPASPGRELLDDRDLCELAPRMMPATTESGEPERRPSGAMRLEDRAE